MAINLLYDESKKPRKAVLLFHGMTGTPTELIYVARAIHDQGFDVYCPVLPGHLAGLREVMSTTWQDWYESSLRDYKSLSTKYEEVFLGGICLGAVIAAMIASREKNIRGLILMAPILFLDGWTIPWYVFLLNFLIYTPLKYFCVFPEKGPLGVKDDGLRDKIKDSFNKKESALDCFPILTVLELLRLSRVARKNFEGVQAPTLLMHSQHDDLASIKSSQVIFDRISSKDKKLFFLEDSYHLIAMDKEKDKVIAEALHFLKEHSHVV